VTNVAVLGVLELDMLRGVGVDCSRPSVEAEAETVLEC
jgi:hypothetical protein